MRGGSAVSRRRATRAPAPQRAPQREASDIYSVSTRCIFAFLSLHFFSLVRAADATAQGARLSFSVSKDRAMALLSSRTSVRFAAARCGAAPRRAAA